MTKEEYKKEMNFLDQQIEEFNNKRIELKKKFIDSNKEFCIGEKVKVVHPPEKNFRGEIVGDPKVEYGLVYDFELNYNLLVKPLIKKIKKDGTMSSINLQIWHNMKVEKCDGSDS